MYSLIEGFLKYGTYLIVGLFVLNKYISLETGMFTIVLSNSVYTNMQSVFENISKFSVAKAAEDRLNVWIDAEQNYNRKIDIKKCFNNLKDEKVIVICGKN